MQEVAIMITMEHEHDNKWTEMEKKKMPTHHNVCTALLQHFWLHNWAHVFIHLRMNKFMLSPMLFNLNWLDRNACTCIKVWAHFQVCEIQETPRIRLAFNENKTVTFQSKLYGYN